MLKSQALLKSEASDGPWLFASLVLGRGARGGQAPMLLSFPTHEDPSPGSFSHVPWPRDLACPCPHGLTMASGWLDSSKHHCSICHSQGGERPHLQMEITQPEVKSNHRSEQVKLQPWCNTTKRLEAMGSAMQRSTIQHSSAQLKKMELKPGR